MKDSDNKYLIFLVGGKKFCMCFSDVLQIIPVQEMREIPDLPDYAEGTLINGGRTVTVIDLRKRFGYTEWEQVGREVIILCDGEKSLGMHCDSITGFVEMQADNIQPAPDINEQVNARFISGTFIYEGEPCYIIKPELIIRPDDEEAFLNNG